MTDTEDTAESLRRHLVRRGVVLDAVLDGGDRRRTLRERLSITESTLDRTLARFETAGLVRRDRGVVEPTVGGELAATSTHRFRRRVGAVFDARDVLATLPPGADVGFDLLVGATTVGRGEGERSPAEVLRSAVGDSRAVHLCVSSPVTEVWEAVGVLEGNTSPGTDATDRTAANGRSDGPVLDVIYSPEAAREAREERFRANHERAVTGRYRAYETSDFDVDLLLVDGDDGRRVVVPAVDDGTLVGVVVSDTEDGVAWAERVVEERRAGATEFTGEFLPGGKIAGGHESRDGDQTGTDGAAAVAADADTGRAPSGNAEVRERDREGSGSDEHDGRGGDEGVDWASRYRLLSGTSEVLGALLDGAEDKRDATARVSASRSTVDRAVRRLVSHGFVGHDGVSAGATVAGRLAHEATAAYRRETDAVVRTGDLLAGLDPETPLDVSLLVGASVERTEADGNLQTYRAALEAVMSPDVETVYACSYAISDTSAPSAASRLVMDLGTTLHVVYRRSVADYVRSAHGDRRREMVETGRYRAFVTPSLPFGLFLVVGSEERRVAVALYDNTTLVGTIVNDSEAAVEWARRTYERYREGSEEITADFLDDGAVPDA